MYNELTEEEKTLLAEIVKSTLETEEGFKYVEPSLSASLVEKGLVEVNPADLKSQLAATRATTIALAMFEGLDKVTYTEEVVAIEKPTYELETGIPIPPKKSKSHGARKYPLDIMEVGSSFHLPKTESVPEPAKRLASAVSGAKNRFKKLDPETGEQVFTRRFTVREVDANDPKGVGARVFRTA